MLEYFDDQVDLCCEPDESLEIEIQERANGKVLYIHSSKGRTVVRISRISKLFGHTNSLVQIEARDG